MARLIRTPDALDAALAELGAAEQIAVDSEFHPEKAYFPKVMLLQLRADDHAPLLVDPLAPLDLTPLGPVLSSRELLVHGGQADLGILVRQCGARPTRAVDTQVLAAFAGLGWPRRLQDLTAAVLGHPLDKGETLSDWGRRPLSPEQLRYAADDVVVLRPLVQALWARVDGYGNRDHAQAALAEVAAAALGPPDDRRLWRRVPGAHLLADRERAALAALAAWREQRARAIDQPPMQVVSDAVLLDLARRRPDTIERLRDNRRMPAQVWRQHGGALLDCIRSATEAAAPAPLRRSVQADAVRLAARAAAEPRGMSGEFLLDDGELEYIFGKTTYPSWRRRALGENFEKFLDGGLSIRFDGQLS